MIRLFFIQREETIDRPDKHTGSPSIIDRLTMKFSGAVVACLSLSSAAGSAFGRANVVGSAFPSMEEAAAMMAEAKEGSLLFGKTAVGNFVSR